MLQPCPTHTHEATMPDAVLIESPRSLPETVAPYRRTADFTEATVPAALLKAHNTKAGVWGAIHVLEGELLYRITDPRRPPSERVLRPSEPIGVVEPAILHEVEPRGAVRFYVAFHR
jgi:tellurite resistance-related uncharacterized protein